MLKRPIQLLIQEFHYRFMLGEYPQKLGIYFHELEPHQQKHFRAMAGAVRKLGYRFVSIEEYLEADDKVAMVSFDDNYQGWHKALPLFESLGIKAVFYVNTMPIADDASPETLKVYYNRVEYKGQRQPLSRQEIKELHQAGHTIGCHTHSHLNLVTAGPSYWQKEIVESRDILANIIDAPVKHFSFPFGMKRHFSRELEDFCMGIGFSTIAEAHPALLHTPPTPRRIPRTLWSFELSDEENIKNFRVVGEPFMRLTGKSAIVFS